MPTGQQVSDAAMMALGILEQGGSASVSDSQDNINELNAQWDAWGIDEGLINQVVTLRFPLVALQAIYSVGPANASGAQPSVNASRPARIYKAFYVTVSAGAIATSTIGDGGIGYAASDTGVILGSNGVLATYSVSSVDANGAVLTYSITAAGTGYLNGPGYPTQVGGGQPGSGSGLTFNITAVTTEGQTRTKLDVVDSETYYSHNDLSATSQAPDELFPDYLPDVDGYTRLYLFPVPKVAAAGALELNQSVNFQPWTLTGNQNLPAGYQDAVQKVLAGRLIPFYGAAVATQVAQSVLSQAEQAEQRIREMNRRNRNLPPGTELPAGAKEQAEEAAAAR